VEGRVSIGDAVVLGDKVILVYNPNSPEAIRFRQVKNLVAYRRASNKRNSCGLRSSDVIEP